MEEQDIRQIWKAGDQKKTTGYSSDQIQRIIEKGSSNVISKFIKTLKIEKWINFFVFFGAMSIMFLERMWITGWAMLVLNVLFYFYYNNLIARLDREIVGSNVLDYLKTMHGHMKGFILHYKLATFVLILPAYVLSIYVAKHDQKGEIFDMINSINEHGLFFHGIAIGLAMIAGLVIIHLMYGRKAVKLHSMINSLNEEES